MKILRESTEVKVWEGELPPSYDTLLEEIREVDGLVSLLTDRLDRRIIEAGKNLKIISNYAVGFDNIDLEAATTKGILVTNTPDVLTNATADLAFALLLATARRVVESVDYVRKGHWKTWGPLLMLGQDVAGATLGLVGLGRIGSAMAKRARGFDMNVLYYDVYRNEELENNLGLNYVSFEDLLSTADFVSIHTPLTEQTRGMFNKSTFARMKKTAILINTARGPIVNEPDLYEALQEGQIWGAGLDVTAPEPIQLTNPLLSLDNVTILPHIASASIGTRTKMSLMVCENLLAGLRGERPVNLVSSP